jgi:hypothetical protein
MTPARPPWLRSGLRPRSRVLAVLVAALAGAATVSPGSAWALTLGLDAFGPLGSPDSSVSGPWVKRAFTEHAGLVRVGVQWSAVAPQHRPQHGFNQKDPGSRYYSWAATDAVVRNLAGRRFALLMVITGAPRWAEGAHRRRGAPAGTWKPDVQAFGRFARAAATRYSGHFPDPLRPGHALPRIRYWEAWNEPNLSFFLTPQWTKQKHGYVNSSPGIYRGLVNSFYAAVKRVSSRNVVVGGATAPFGDLSPSQRNNARMQPVPFVRALLCLHGKHLRRGRCPHPAHMDVLDHHPYSIGGPFDHAVNAGDVSVPDMGKLTRLLRAAVRHRTLLPPRAKHVWATELGWVSKPPDPQGLPLSKQARWLEQALYVLWRQRVSTVCWLQIADDRGPNSLDAGLYFARGKSKPAARAFRFPFVVIAKKHHPVRVWGRSPAGGTVRIERRSGQGWRTIRRLKVRRYGVFSATLRLHRHPTLRAQIANQTSLNWAKA